MPIRINRLIKELICAGVGPVEPPGEYQPQTGYTSWLLKRAERRAAASLYDSLRELGLTPSQYGVLGAR